MQAGKTGYVEFTPNVTWAAVRVAYEQQLDLAQNRSVFHVTGIEVKSTGYTGTYYIDGLVQLDGQTLLQMNSAAGTVSVTVAGKNTWYPVVDTYGEKIGASLQIPHDSDGKKSVQLTLTGNRFQRFAFYTIDEENGNGWGVRQSQSLALTDIPRAAVIGATDGYIGSVSTVTVTRYSQQHSYSVAYAFGELQGWLGEDGACLDREQKMTASSIPFALPEQFYEQIPNQASMECRLICRTYLADAQIGQDQQTAFTVTAAPALCGPVVTGWVEEANQTALALTGNPSRLIRYVSTARCHLQAYAQKGAQIISKSIGGVQLQEWERDLEKVEDRTVVFSAADSRGYAGSHLVSLDLIDYIPLTARVSAQRTDPTSGRVRIQVKGNWFSGSFGAVDNTLQLRYQVADREGELVPEAEDGGYTASAELEGLDYRSIYAITVTARDAVGQVSGSYTLGKGVPVFEWGEEDFVFHVPVSMDGGMTCGGKTLWELIYPVGAVYMGAEDTDPGDLFGGVWLAVENPLALFLWQRVG